MSINLEAEFQFLTTFEFDWYKDRNLVVNLPLAAIIHNNQLEKKSKKLKSNYPHGKIAFNTWHKLQICLSDITIIKHYSTKAEQDDSHFFQSDEYKRLIVNLSEIVAYSLSNLEFSDEYFSKTLGIIMRVPKASNILQPDVLNYSLLTCFGFQLISGTKWVSLFTKELKQENLLLHHIFIKPILYFSSKLLEAQSECRILFLGLSILRKYGALCIEKIEGEFKVEVDAITAFSKKQLRQNRFLKIAEGDETLSKKLGKKMYNEFESDLSKIFESFGYFVSLTKIGDRRVDLIVSSPNPNSFTFLVDAKSKKTPYNLPVQDERAISEYIQRYQNSRMAVPKLNFFLIVSASPSSHLEEKLKQLGHQCSIPIKFISATDLLFLYNNVTFVLFYEEFNKMVTETNPIITQTDIIKLLEKVKIKKDAFINFIKAIQY